MSNNEGEESVQYPGKYDRSYLFFNGVSGFTITLTTFPSGKEGTKGN